MRLLPRYAGAKQRQPVFETEWTPATIRPIHCFRYAAYLATPGSMHLRKGVWTMFMRSSIRGNAVAAKSRRPSQVKKSYVTAASPARVHTRIDPSLARMCALGGLVPGWSRRADQRRVRSAHILTATPLISASPGHTIFVRSSNRGNAASSKTRRIPQPAMRYVTWLSQPSEAERHRQTTTWAATCRRSSRP